MSFLTRNRTVALAYCLWNNSLQPAICRSFQGLASPNWNLPIHNGRWNVRLPLMAGLVRSQWWRGCGLWCLLWPSLWLIEICLAGCNKQNKIWDNKNVSMFKKAQNYFPEKEPIGTNWKSLDFIFTFMKERNPHLRKIQLCLWNSSLLKNDWKQGREVEGRRKRKWEGGREKRLVYRAWNMKYNLTISVPASPISKYILYFLLLIKWSRYKPEASSFIR